jgi:hypothetical protein
MHMTVAGLGLGFLFRVKELHKVEMKRQEEKLRAEKAAQRLLQQSKFHKEYVSFPSIEPVGMESKM